MRGLPSHWWVHSSIHSQLKGLLEGGGSCRRWGPIEGNWSLGTCPHRLHLVPGALPSWSLASWPPQCEQLWLHQFTSHHDILPRHQPKWMGLGEHRLSLWNWEPEASLLHIVPKCSVNSNEGDWHTYHFTQSLRRLFFKGFRQLINFLPKLFFRKWQARMKMTRQVRTNNASALWKFRMQAARK